MKKLIVLIVFVIIVLGILKIMGIGFSVSSSPDKQKTQEETGEHLTNAYKRWTYEDITGFSLPEGASEIHHKKYIVSTMSVSDIFRDNLSTNYVFCWVVAKLPEEDFDMFVDNYELEKMPNLLESQPDILELHENVSFPNWNINNRTIEDVYFNEPSDYEEYTACTYQDGKIYIKKVITYIQYVDENKWHYEKATRDR